MTSYILETTSILPLSKKKPQQAIILCHGYGGDGKDIFVIRSGDGSSSYIFPQTNFIHDFDYEQIWDCFNFGRFWWSFPEVMVNVFLQFWPFLVVVFRHECGQIWFWSTTRLKALHQCSKTWGYSFPNSKNSRSYRLSIFAIFAIFGGSFLL